MIHPKHGYYSTESKRLESFKSWPMGLPQQPKDMAEAGFFYTGMSDKVICYYCDGKFKDWTSTDHPWIIHARYCKSCPYVLIMKSEEFVQKVQNLPCECKICKPDFKSKEKEPSADDSKLQLSTESHLICKICYENTVNSCFIPCGHAVACVKCALSISKNCPVCRKAYNNIIRVYF